MADTLVGAISAGLFPRRGRAPGPPEKVRAMRLWVQVTVAEYDAVCCAATRDRLSISEYLRRLIPGHFTQQK